MHALSPQSTLQQGKYIIQRVLGQGGFGITYEGLQTGLNRRVAIKEFFMRDSCERSGNIVTAVGTEGTCQQVALFREKFVKEAQLIATLDQAPHVVRIYDIFEENQTAYYVMEFIEGGSLDDIVHREGVLPEARAVAIVSQAAEALDALHQRQTMHLDVKPSNILVRRDRQGDDDVVLIDFGVSKHYDGEGHQTTSTPVGLSKGFAPLEQYREGGVSAFSPATDVYSLGATLYYLLSGSVPPEAADLLSTSLSRPAGISAPLWQVITRAMSIRPADRYQSMGEMMKTLRRVPLARLKPAPKAKRTEVLQVETKQASSRHEASRTTILHADTPTVASTDAPAAASDTSVEAPHSQFPSWLQPAVCAIVVVFLVVVGGIMLQRCDAPSEVSYEDTDTTCQNGADMMIVLDISSSMLAEDIEPNRIEAAKRAFSSMIDYRSDDRIGLTVFAGEAFTLCPLVDNYAELRYLLQTLNNDIASNGTLEDGTAIGDALACALNQLKDSKAAHRVVVLLTDGSNNAGVISPQTATSIAETLGVRVYTIALGTNGTARYPIKKGNQVHYVQIPVEVDSATLRPMAESTNGRFFPINSCDALHAAIATINAIEMPGSRPETDPSTMSHAMSREEACRLLDTATAHEELVQMKVRVASGY